MNAIKKFPAFTGLFLLLGFFVLSVWLIFEYAEKERNRDLMNWQARLGIIADTRKAAVEDWISDQKKQLSELSNNPTLQLYLSQYSSSANSNDEIMNAQLSHVRNLLHAASARFGFSQQASSSINIEYDSTRDKGLAVLDASANLLFSTKGFPKDLSRHKLVIERAITTAAFQLIDLYAAGNEKAAYGLVLPVFHIQKMQSQQAIGAVVVLFNPEDNLFRIIENKHLDTSTDETLLIKQTKNSLVFVSPLLNEFKVFHQMPVGNKNLAANFAYENIGGFALKRDYQGHDVLVTGRKIENTPWVLMQKISAKEALEESNKHQRFLLTTFLLLTLLLAALFIAIWRHSTSVRLQKITSVLESRTALLNAVSDNINEHIFLIDQDSHFVFANLSLANNLKVNPEDVIGKKLPSVVGSDVAETILGLSCNEDSGTQGCVVNLPLGDESDNYYHISSVELQQGDYKNTKLFVLHDITRLKSAQEKRDRLARGIISTLVKSVDLHDPYCVNHSERTREVAVDIALELNLEKERRDALELAALLANIGKLYVPREILIKMEPLSEDENDVLKKHIEYAVDILKQLEFEGPVVEIISQKNECLDGSGYPEGTVGDSILLESRILAVSNAFVAMTSSRAYRKGRAIKDVIDVLLQQADACYDRHVVAALFHIAENKTDWQKWQSVSRDE
ncbi:MAG: HD domain-containing protein [Gammaproteobacteria bacterium]|nr:HD domain-containing protein [Gammaproteobacteria bacterium]